MLEFIKKYLYYLLSFLVGIGVGMLLCLIPSSVRIGKRDVIVKTEVKVKEVVKAYTPLELKKNTIKLNVPNISTKEYVLLPADPTIIYRDSIRYGTLPREYFYTKQDDVEIWHSGIGSRIDSLRYTQKETVVTETYKRRDWRHEVEVYGSVGYHQGMRIPVGVEYSFYPKRWIGIGGKAEYDISTKTTGVYAKANIRFGW